MGAMINVFILHGWTYSTEKWKPFVNLFKQNGIVPTLLKIPGLTEKLESAWALDDYLFWFKKITDDTHNKSILIGHSNGGRIALNFAIKYPQKLAHLVLIDSAGIYHDEFSIKIKRLVFGHIAKIGKKLSSSKTLRNLLYKIVGESDYKNANPVMRQIMVNLINSDRSLSLDKITVKTLIIWGEDDKVTPLSDGKIMNKLIKNSKLYVIKGAKHSPQFTNTKEVADIILETLNVQ